MRWGGGGDSNKPCRPTRTWRLRWAAPRFYKHLLLGGLGWGGVGWGQQQALPPHRDLTSTLGGFSFVQISSFGLVGLGWGWVGAITNPGALPGHEDTSHWPDVKLYQIFLWVGWGGVGWGGDNNKPCRPTRTWRLRWAAPHLYKHLVMGGLGRGGVGTITSLAALQGPDDYAGRLFVSTNIFFWVGWVGVGWGGDNNKPCRLTGTWQVRWAAFHLYKYLLLGWLGWGGVGWGQ